MLASVHAGGFRQQVATQFKQVQAEAVVMGSAGAAYAATSKGLYVFSGGGEWTPAPGDPGLAVTAMTPDGDGVAYIAGGQLRRGRRSPAPAPEGAIAVAILAGEPVFATAASVVERGKPDASFARVAGASPGIRQIAASGGALAVAANAGLFERDIKGEWRRILPRQGSRSWAVEDCRAVAYGSDGRLAFASAEGFGVRGGEWRLYDVRDGLPYDDLTSIAAAPDGSIWLGTRFGAVHFVGGVWEYRQGLRWLPNDAVRSVATAGDRTWFATALGVGMIGAKPMTLAEKARFFEDEIDRRHRRTEYGYVLGVNVAKPGDKSDYRQEASDNDGLWTSMYGAGECFACNKGSDVKACERATAAFEALRFLGVVTQGGEHPAPRGFVARAIMPVSGPNPNQHDNPARDRRTRASRDPLWKVIDPRWPVSADGKWYWKTDTSSDELDGHYFFYGLYFDLAARTEEQKRRVREHVAALTDHLIDHGFRLVDHDGKVTRWGTFDPASLNHDPEWWEERSLNSISILSYLKVAEHITGEPRFAEAARKLIAEHSYAMNTLIAKTPFGPGSGNQSDDEMAFMCLYNLTKYETDPKLLAMYQQSLRQRWDVELPELCPLFNYVGANGLKQSAGDWLGESLDTLERFPLDRFNWALKNSHRKDLVVLPGFASDSGDRVRGHRRNGQVLPIDERYVNQWNHDPWRLDVGGDGRHLADGAAFLLPYYMGRYEGFIKD